MRTLKVLTSILIAVLIGFSSLFAQGFQPPAEGRSVIYFVNLKKKDAFEYFLQDKYIGVIKKGKNYLRIECSPGEHLFWASAENKEFVTTDLMVGGTYIIICQAKMGGWSSRVKLIPITEDNELFEQAKALINEKGPIVMPESTIELRNSELVEFIDNIMEHYENEWKTKYNFQHISADMAIPDDKLK